MESYLKRQTNTDDDQTGLVTKIIVVEAIIIYIHSE